MYVLEAHTDGRTAEFPCGGFLQPYAGIHPMKDRAELGKKSWGGRLRAAKGFRAKASAPVQAVCAGIFAVYCAFLPARMERVGRYDGVLLRTDGRRLQRCGISPVTFSEKAGTKKDIPPGRDVFSCTWKITPARCGCGEGSAAGAAGQRPERSLRRSKRRTRWRRCCPAGPEAGRRAAG